jgi:hypothetical protein
MLRWLRTYGIAAALGATVAAAVLGGATYVQAQQSSSDVIKACVNRNSGLVRIVHSNSCASPSENFVTWNQQGPAGAPGVLGFYTVSVNAAAGTAVSALCR